MKLKYWIYAGVLSLACNGFSDIVAVSNADQTQDYTNPVYDVSGGDPAYTGLTLTTGADGDYQITGISLTFGVHVDPTGDFTLQLYTDVAGSPGTLEITLTGASNPASSSVVAYTYDDGLGNGYDIDANTTYWLVASVINGTPTSQYDWISTDGPESSSLGWSLGGTTEINSDMTTGATFSDTLMLSVSVIPEPAVMGLVVLFGGSLLITKRIFLK